MERGYQGMIFLMPFFLLLEDSVVGSALPELGEACSELVALVASVEAAGVEELSVAGAVDALESAGAAGFAAALPVALPLPLALALLVATAASASVAVEVSSLLSPVGRAGLLAAGSAAGWPDVAGAAAAPSPTGAADPSEAIGAGKLFTSVEGGASVPPLGCVDPIGGELAGTPG